VLTDEQKNMNVFLETHGLKYYGTDPISDGRRLYKKYVQEGLSNHVLDSEGNTHKKKSISGIQETCLQK